MESHRMAPQMVSTPGQQVTRAARLFARVADARLKPLGFTLGQVPVLVALRDGQALPQAELARLARTEQSSMAQLLDRMERDGLIQRVPDPQDGRRRLISLTPAAAGQMTAARQAVTGVAEEASLGFTSEEQALLLGLLTRFGDNLETIAARLAP